MQHPVHRLRLLGTIGSNKLLSGEASRLIRRRFERDRANAFVESMSRFGTGSVVLAFDPDLAWLLVNYHRTAARCLWDIYESRASRLEKLYEDLLTQITQETRNLWPDGGRISVEAFHPESIEAGERQVVGAVKNAILEGAKALGRTLTVDPEHPDISVSVRSHLDEAGRGVLTVSIDLSGEPLHRRGYRLATADAPLREDLAAQLVMLARYDGRQQFLIDPLAGTGTILMEALHAAEGRPLWAEGRGPAGQAWVRVLGRYEAPQSLFADTQARAFAAELDPVAGRSLAANLDASGLSERVGLHQGDFRTLDPAAIRERAKGDGYTSGILITNPPYGARLKGSDEELFSLYEDIARFARELKVGNSAFLLGEPRTEGTSRRSDLLEDAFRARARVKKPLKNGPLDAQFLMFDAC